MEGVGHNSEQFRKPEIGREYRVLLQTKTIRVQLAEDLGNYTWKATIIESDNESELNHFVKVYFGDRDAIVSVHPL